MHINKVLLALMQPLLRLQQPKPKKMRKRRFWQQLERQPWLLPQLLRQQRMSLATLLLLLQRKH
ncbi:MAG: hypothetical protein EB082_18130 [Verrucomicrobia bacterium]|nr:hypothetical protein [Verrucomicrobiota bacterium]